MINTVVYIQNTKCPLRLACDLVSRTFQRMICPPFHCLWSQCSQHTTNFFYLLCFFTTNSSVTTCQWIELTTDIPALKHRNGLHTDRRFAKWHTQRLHAGIYQSGQVAEKNSELAPDLEKLIEFKNNKTELCELMINKSHQNSMCMLCSSNEWQWWSKMQFWCYFSLFNVMHYTKHHTAICRLIFRILKPVAVQLMSPVILYYQQVWCTMHTEHTVTLPNGVSTSFSHCFSNNPAS